MTAVNYSTIRSRFLDYCNRVADDAETVIVTRKDEKNVVLISLEEYNALIKLAKNAEYLAMLDRSLAQIERGETVTKTMDELEAME
ncbi:MAG: type II toxin-antitoxin system Phd/YefM family antitoxin [Oscillospiraceae bacterium]|nr:type II toxin-antitoxin system Phd/YefM family antitoxin [Oscillospiraceae bacterium]